MNQRSIGIVLIAISVLLGIFVFIAQTNDQQHADTYLAENGTCFLDDGTCLHDQNQWLFIFGWVIAGVLLLFGVYLAFFDRTQQVLAEHQVKVSTALESAQRQEREKDEFRAFLSGFNEDEQKVVKAIREQEGIKQSTLRYRTGLSKTALSLLLKQLEKDGVVSRENAGKTKKVHLIRKF